MLFKVLSNEKLINTAFSFLKCLEVKTYLPNGMGTNSLVSMFLATEMRPKRIDYLYIRSEELIPMAVKVIFFFF